MTDVPKSAISIHPENTTGSSFISTNKGLVLAVSIGLALVVVGIMALLNMNSSQQYQGLIQNVQNQTKMLESKIDK